MQQPTSPMMPVMPPFSPANITTEQIQKYLDENKKLILAILDNQNLGKLAECAQYQAQLQKNLMYLAAIADAQPQLATMPAAQMAPHPAMQQGAFYMQQQAAAMGQQPGVFSPRMPAQFATPMQLQEQQHQQQQLHQHHQAISGQMNFRPTGPSSNITSTGAPPTLASTSEISGRNKQDGSEAVTGGDGQGSSAIGAGHSGGEGDTEGR